MQLRLKDQESNLVCEFGETPLVCGTKAGRILIPGSLSNCEDKFYGMLEEAQVRISEAFGLPRSKRPGVTDHAMHMKA